MCGDDRFVAGSALDLPATHSILSHPGNRRCAVAPVGFGSPEGGARLLYAARVLYHAVDGGRLPAVTSSRATAHGLHKSVNFRVILDALALLHPATDIHCIRPDPSNRLGNIGRSQATRENDWFAQARRYQ